MNMTAVSAPLGALFLIVALGGGAGRAKAEATFGEALDTPDLVWTHSGVGQWVTREGPGAHDGVDMVEILDQVGPDDEPVTATLSTEVTGPAVVRFWWRYVASVTDPDMRVGVDDAFVFLPTRFQGPDGWSHVEMQLSAGVHTLAFRPYLGTVVQVDEVTVTPGPGSLTASAGVAALSWMVPVAGAWNADADAPSGLSASGAWSGGGSALAACLFPPDSKAEGWIKLTGPGYFRAGAEPALSYYLSRTPSAEWQRIRVVSASRWLTLAAEPGQGNAAAALNLKLAGFQATPAGWGDILDAPELAWTATGSSPFIFSAIESGLRQTGSLVVEQSGAFETSLTTSLTGPGRLFFNTMGFKFPDDHWRVSMNGIHTDLVELQSGAWERRSVIIPPGVVTAQLTAINVANTVPDYGYFSLDDVTYCVPADAAQKEALDLPAASELWVRQSSSGLWSRTTAESRDGVDSLVLAPSPSARLADLILPTIGAPLAGVWIKTSPETEVSVSPSGAGLPYDVRLFKPADSTDWTWIPLHAGPGSTDLRFAIPAASDKGGEVFLDGLTLYTNPVSVAEALETPDRTWVGGPGLALPGSDALGEKAVLVTRPNTVTTVVNGPFRLKYRYRLCGTLHFSDATIRLDSVILRQLGSTAAIPVGPASWQEAELTRFDAQPGAVLTFRCDAGAMLLDQVEIIPLSEVTVPEALDAPGLSAPVPAGWKGIAGFGRSGDDVVISPSMVRPAGGQAAIPQQSDLIVFNGVTGGGVDGSFWWNKESTAGELSFEVPGVPLAPGRTGYSGSGWQHLRMHYDQAPVQMLWRQYVRWPLVPVDTIPAADVMIDGVSLVPATLGSFNKALDTEAAGAAIGFTGWNAIGDAVATVQSAVGWHGGSALEIRPTPGGNASQSVVICGRFTTGTDLSCRVKRGVREDVSLTLVIDEADFAPIPLSPEWTEFRTLLPPAYAASQPAISFRFTVPDAGPEAVVYLDAVSLREASDENAALETTGLSWSSGGDGQMVIGGQVLQNLDYMPPYEGYFDGVSLQGLTDGKQHSLWTEITGPGTVVLAGYNASPGSWNTRVEVGGVTRDALLFLSHGPFGLQAPVPAGTHTVRWVVERISAGFVSPSGLQLHSLAFVSGPPADALPAALEALSPGRVWTSGGSHPPQPLYYLREGVMSLHGMWFPALAPGESSWLETSVSGPAGLHFTWRSGTAAVCRVDGRTAVLAAQEPSANTPPQGAQTALELPAGAHTVRWEGKSATAELRQVSTTPGSAIAAVVAGAGQPIVWFRIHPSVYSGDRGWAAVTDGMLSGFDDLGQPLEVPGTGLPALAGGDLTSGSFWMTGPAVLTYDLRQLNHTGVYALVDGDEYFRRQPFLDLRWHQEAIVVPAGEHLISFSIQEDDAGYEPYSWLKSFRINTASSYPNWAAGNALTSLHDSSPLTDPDNDGVVNLIEYAFGRNPRGAGGPATLSITGPPDALRLQFPSLPYDAAGLRYDVQSSPDLQTWTTVATVGPNAPDQPGPGVLLPASQGVKVFYRVLVHL